MPQVDLEPARAVPRGGSGGDGRVTCETLLNAPPPPPPPPPQHDLPAESYYLSRQDEFDWFNRNNVFYERKESTKGNSTSTSTSAPISHRSGNSKSTKSKASIIGLPKPQTPSFPDPKSLRTCKARFFPKRLGSAAKFSLRLSEPSSPKVSCTGRVRSNRSRCRRSKEISETKTGFWSSFKQVFWFSCQRSDSVQVDVPVERMKSPSRKSVGVDKKRKAATEEEVNTTPGLGGMNRFVSGRRSDSWAGDAVDLERAGHDS